LSVQVSPTTVDVNVHPNKRECTLLHQDSIIKSLAEHFRNILRTAGKSFAVASIEKPTITNPYKRRKSDPNGNELSLSQTSQKSMAPSKKIRTSRATQSGALEPYLVRKEPFSQASDVTNASMQLSPTQLTQESADSPSQRLPMVHMRGCPLSEPTNVDLTQPGAFASVSSQCTCNIPDSTGAAAAIRLPRQALSRPKKLPPKECHYESILSLRKASMVQVDKDTEYKLRHAYFVGVVSSHRSLVQVEEELIILNHGDAAEELFYQLALNHFPGGAAVAKLGGAGIDIHSIVAEFVQMEETLQSSSPLPAEVEISETNQILAEQAADCLLQHAEMLRDYFSIVIQKNSDNDRVMLTGLPILLKGYAPSAHALPLFLLRLATEVNWTEEKPCFHGICQELGRFNASISTDDHLASHVQHALFPALSSLLLPSQHFVSQKGFYGVTKLSKLYRVFERC
jgi:DNA mismatch repair protein MLH1